VCRARGGGKECRAGKQSQKSEKGKSERIGQIEMQDKLEDQTPKDNHTCIERGVIGGNMPTFGGQRGE